jgi:hypothetical protein
MGASLLVSTRKPAVRQGLRAAFGNPATSRQLDTRDACAQGGKAGMRATPGRRDSRAKKKLAGPANSTGPTSHLATLPNP